MTPVSNELNMKISTLNTPLYCDGFSHTDTNTKITDWIAHYIFKGVPGGTFQIQAYLCS